MSCFSCFSKHDLRSSSSRRMNNSRRRGGPIPTAAPHPREVPPQQHHHHHHHQQQRSEISKKSDEEAADEGATNNIAGEIFTFRELASATRNFRQDSLLGEGGFGRVYKGKLEKTGQVVAVKQLDRNGLQGNKEFLVEVLMLSLLHHPNLVNLIGYCADGEQRLLVYEYMQLGSLDDYLFGNIFEKRVSESISYQLLKRCCAREADIRKDKEPIDWSTRIKIALSAAKGLEYLHDKADPPVIYRDLKSSNILLDDEYNAKLSDFGLAKLGPTGEKAHVSSRVMGTYGYCAPEYQKKGQLTVKSDVYSFGVVLLELITGRRAIDTTRKTREQTLVSWAEPMFREPSRYHELADPLLKGEFPVKSLNQAVAVAAMCLQDDAATRPLMSDVVTALSYLGADDAEAASPLLKPASPLNEAEDEAMEWGSNAKEKSK